MLHSVYFWLKPELSEDDRNTFKKELAKLQAIPCLTFAYTGMPSDTRRPSIDHSYDFVLLTHFKSLKEHDEYQVDPIHKNFLAVCSGMWEKVKVYDFDEF